MARIAADNALRSSGGGERQVLVVFGVTSFRYGLGRLNSFRRKDHCVEDQLAAFDRNEPVEFWPEQNLPIFVLHRAQHHARTSAHSGTLSAVSTAEIKAEASKTTITRAARSAKLPIRHRQLM